MSTSEKTVRITQVSASNESVFSTPKADAVAVEEPLEIRLVSGPEEKRKGKSLSITMRTPGDDFELAVGFLVSEAIVSAKKDVVSVEHVGEVAAGQGQPNRVRVELDSSVSFAPTKLNRHFYTTSSCGVCGKASLEALELQEFQPVESTLQIAQTLVMQLPNKLRGKQTVFATTGGIHAAGLFTPEGELVTVREDVGRHNALDKLIGHQLLNDKFPLDDSMLVVSGRASFELLQKALSASIPIFVAVGAPSSLAIELAEKFSITLIGFASQNRFNIYSHPERIV